MNRILIVEDEPDIAAALRSDLPRQGYQTAVAVDGEAALKLAGEVPFELILLDIMLPGQDGFAVCRQLRQRGVHAVIILLTARTHEAEKVLGFELGADDYVTKPFSPAELRARIKAHLRRTGEPDAVYRFGPWEVDCGRGEVRRAGSRADITAHEMRLLVTLLRRRGRVLTREQLIAGAWEANTNIGDRVVDTHILNLRKKVEDDPRQPRWITSVRGVGYRFEPES